MLAGQSIRPHSCKLDTIAMNSPTLLHLRFAKYAYNPRTILILLSVIAVLVLIPLVCVSLLAITSRCGFSAEWNALVFGAPRVPIPDGTVILSQRDSSGRPLSSGSGSGISAYGELYHSTT